MGRVKMLAVSFSVSCGLGFIGSGGVKISVDSFYLLSWQGWSAMKIPVDSFYLFSCLGLMGKGALKCRWIRFVCHVG